MNRNKKAAQIFLIFMLLISSLVVLSYYLLKEEKEEKIDKFTVSGFVLNENIKEFNNSDFFNEYFKDSRNWKSWGGRMESDHLISTKNQIGENEDGKIEIVNLKAMYYYNIDSLNKKDVEVEQKYPLMSMSSSIEVGVDNDDLISIITFNIKHNDIFYDKIKSTLNDEYMTLLHVDVGDQQKKGYGQKYHYTFKYKYKDETEINKNVKVALFFTSYLNKEEIEGKPLDLEHVNNLSISFYDLSLINKEVKEPNKIF